MAKAKKIKITQVKSPIGQKENMGRTLIALGLKKIGQSVVHAETDQIKGMIRTVHHLVETEAV